MAAIPVHHTKTDTDSPWDGPAEVAAAPNDRKVLRYMHAWEKDGGDPDAKGTYKTPHHQNGTDTAANIHGVNNGLARLASTDIPTGDKPGVEKHLRAHRKDAGLEDRLDGGEILGAVNHIAKVDALNAEEKKELLQAVQRQEEFGAMHSPKRAHTPIRCFDGNAKPYEPFWRLRNADETGGDPEMELYGYISEYSWLDDDVTPQMFKDDLYRLGNGGPITVRLNSGGGDVVAASMIRAFMTDYPGPITVRIDGLAASAAVIVAMAGQTVKIMDTAYMMIHDPAVAVFMAVLDIETMGEWYNEMVTIKKGIVDTYAAKTGLKQEKLSKMMSDTTWMSAEEAVEYGFANEIIEGGQAPASNMAIVNALRTYQNVPAVLLNLQTGPRSEPPIQLPPEAIRLQAEVKILIGKGD